MRMNVYYKCLEHNFNRFCRVNIHYYCLDLRASLKINSRRLVQIIILRGYEAYSHL